VTAGACGHRVLALGPCRVRRAHVNLGGVLWHPWQKQGILRGTPEGATCATVPRGSHEGTQEGQGVGCPETTADGPVAPTTSKT
jgi:hypothetical protein